MNPTLSFIFLLTASVALAQGTGTMPEDVSASAGTIAENATEDELAIYLKDVDPAIVRKEDGLVIWPVPTREELHIHCATERSGNIPFEIVDLTGKVVLRGSIVSGQVNMVEFNSPGKGDHLLRVVDGRSIRSIAFRRIVE